MEQGSQQGTSREVQEVGLCVKLIVKLCILMFMSIYILMMLDCQWKSYVTWLAIKVKHFLAMSFAMQREQGSTG